MDNGGDRREEGKATREEGGRRVGGLEGGESKRRKVGKWGRKVGNSEAWKVRGQEAAFHSDYVQLCCYMTF